MKNAGTPQIAQPASPAVFQLPDPPRDTVPYAATKGAATKPFPTLAEVLASTVALGDAELGI
jgi:hypothetical protein